MIHSRPSTPPLPDATSNTENYMNDSELLSFPPTLLFAGVWVLRFLQHNFRCKAQRIFQTSHASSWDMSCFSMHCWMLLASPCGCIYEGRVWPAGLMFHALMGCPLLLYSVHPRDPLPRTPTSSLTLAASAVPRSLPHPWKRRKAY